LFVYSAMYSVECLAKYSVKCLAKHLVDIDFYTEWVRGLAKHLAKHLAKCHKKK